MGKVVVGSQDDVGSDDFGRRSFPSFHHHQHRPLPFSLNDPDHFDSTARVVSPSSPRITPLIACGLGSLPSTNTGVTCSHIYVVLEQESNINLY